MPRNGRPRLPIDRRRSVMLNIRVTPVEREELRRAWLENTPSVDHFSESEWWRAIIVAEARRQLAHALDRTEH